MLNFASALQHTWCTTVLAVLPPFIYMTYLIVLQFLLYFFNLHLCDLFVLHDAVVLFYEFLCIHVHPKVWISLSPYFLHLLVAVCEILSTIHIAPHKFSHFFPCTSYSLFYLCIFWICFGLGRSDCEWMARFELFRCSNLPEP